MAAQSGRKDNGRAALPLVVGVPITTLRKKVPIMDPVMADTSSEAVIHAPVDSIDLTKCVFPLTDQEYQACSKAHIAAGVSRTADGKRKSINVEHLGRLLTQHYIEEVSERQHCRLRSRSDTVGPSIEDRGHAAVLWKFYVEAIDASSTKFINRVQSSAVPGWEEVPKKLGVTLDEAKERLSAVIRAYNAYETPNFANDIEQKALAGRWKRQGSAACLALPNRQHTILSRFNFTSSTGAHRCGVKTETQIAGNPVFCSPAHTAALSIRPVRMVTMPPSDVSTGTQSLLST